MVDLRMPFGKHQGKPLHDIPMAYLGWLLDQCDLRPSLREAVQAEYTRRLQGSNDTSGQLDIRALAQSWYRQMAMRWHPDRGGSNTAMQAVNDGYQRLLDMLENPRNN
jgi:hypothetical protein